MPRDEEERTHRFARLVAVVAGIAGLLLCGLVPLLPVKQTTATISWPQASGPDGLITDITAPLVSGAPQALDISIPCQAVATLPDAGGLVVSTIPPAGIDASRNGLFVRATADVVVVAVRDSVAAVAPRPAVESGACSTLHIWANPGEVGADFIGIPGAAGVVSPDKKPQVAGVFTDLKVAAQAGLSARIDIDTRFITSPTPLKLGVMVLGVAAVIASIVALAVLDRRSRPGGDIRPERRRRFLLAWRRFWRVSLATWLADIGVVGTLLLWHVIGALSSDDGYNLTIARVSDDAGYTANYYRFFGASEAPFDWYQSVLAQFASISTASVWMRIPATLAGLATWLILSRCVLPRLGARLAANRVTVWTGGAVFLAAWLPFNNGLRPEPLIAFGVIAAWILVEYAIGARRVAPYAVAIVVAMFSVTLAPQGLIALAPLLVGARAVAAIIRRRRAVDGIVAPLATVLSSVSLVFVIVFRDQTLATVAESARIKYVVGPTIAWYQEFLRYYFLTVEDSVDSSLTRRFAVLVLLLCLFGMLTVLLRKGGVPGMARGPVWRLIGATAIGLLLLHFTPTKWAVQFGVFAGLAGAMGAVTAFAFARVGLHSRRNLALYVTALLFVLAWATSGINSLVLCRQLRRSVVRQAAGDRRDPGAHHLPGAGDPDRSARRLAALPDGLHRTHRGGRHPPQSRAGVHPTAGGGHHHGRARGRLDGQGRHAALSRLHHRQGERRGDGLGPVPQLAARWPTTCSSSPTPTPVCCSRLPGQRFGEYGPLGGEDPVGFTPNGVSDTLEPAEAVPVKPGLVNSDGSPNEPIVGVGYAAGTGGGYGPRGVNGSNVFLPFGLDPKRTPVMGSYDENTVAAEVTSAWYQLPPRTQDRPLVTVTAAGAIWYYEEDGSFNYGQSLKLQWGAHRPDGSYQALGDVQPIDIFPQKAWRNLRFPLASAPPEANVARIVADDPNLSTDQWFAFTPPRVPVLQTAQQFLGSQTPVLMDIATAANFPCQRPFSEHLGVAELPEYRILPDFKQLVSSSNMWQSAQDGGPFLFVQALLRTSAVPSYLRDDWYRDWGAIESYDRVVPSSEAPDAAVEQGSMRVFGWSRNGPIRALP